MECLKDQINELYLTFQETKEKQKQELKINGIPTFLGYHNLIWTKDLREDDAYNRGRWYWLKFTDRIRSIAKTNLQMRNVENHLSEEVNKNDKKLAAEETVKTMCTVFLKYGVLDGQNVNALQDFDTFGHIARSCLLAGSLTADQVCNFTQQMLYFHFCDDFMADVGNYRFHLFELTIGILLQSFLLKWHSIPVCPCLSTHYTKDYDCHHNT